MLTLHQFRIKFNITQSELARMAGLTITCISRVENGMVNPKRQTQQKIENSANQKIDWRRTLIDGIIRSSKNRKHE